VKILILIEFDPDKQGFLHHAAWPNYIQNEIASNFEYEGFKAERIDVEGVDGVTRESIISDIMHVGSPEENFDAGVRLGQALARKDRQR
jgi:hypothetical protein